MKSLSSVIPISWLWIQNKNKNLLQLFIVPIYNMGDDICIPMFYSLYISRVAGDICLLI